MPARYMFFKAVTDEPISFCSYGIVIHATNVLTPEKVRMKFYQEIGRDQGKTNKFMKNLFFLQHLLERPRPPYLIGLVDYRKLDDRAHRVVVENISEGMFRISGLVVADGRIKSLLYQLSSAWKESSLVHFIGFHVETMA
ncbi:cyclin-dependent kinase 2-like [Prunus yedoensis var. nudiflora]|uniref:Cyclin-dependent kinase 2-like n=1 Tax=Prunus yedoensis var. nudiflora TaxID=2094558 RepID=A0A314YKK6_PRUYE|nr:cyclin-dependent kinase 2-like [Prunus yedoensis var. nudiflora]